MSGTNGTHAQAMYTVYPYFGVSRFRPLHIIWSDTILENLSADNWCPQTRFPGSRPLAAKFWCTMLSLQRWQRRKKTPDFILEKKSFGLDIPRKYFLKKTAYCPGKFPLRAKIASWEADLEKVTISAISVLSTPNHCSVT